MTREEMEELVRTVTLEVVKELKRHGGSQSTDSTGSTCGCSCGGEGCSSEDRVANSTTVSPDRFRGRVLTEASLQSASTNGKGALLLRPGTLVTPLARDLAAELRVELKFESEQSPEGAASSDVPPILCPTNTVAFLSARGSLTHERIVAAAADKAGFQVQPCAAGDRSSGTAPALSCARLVSAGKCCRGVIISDEIYTVLRQANRLNGVKAQVCRDVEKARECRRSETNLLLLSDGQLGLKMLERILEVWLGR
jgi:ribose 5-phosphate isomerase RpiB